MKREMIKPNLHQIPNMSPSFHSKVVNKKKGNHMSFITTYSIPKENNDNLIPKLNQILGGKTFQSGITNRQICKLV
jgi:hypothetical protein